MLQAAEEQLSQPGLMRHPFYTCETRLTTVFSGRRDYLVLKRATNTSTRAACLWAQLGPHLNFARKQDFC